MRYSLARRWGLSANFHGEDIWAKNQCVQAKWKRNNSFQSIKATATGFSSIRKPLDYREILLQDNHSRWNDSWVAVILAFNLFHLFSFSSQGLYNRCAKPFLFLDFDQIYNPLSQTMPRFCSRNYSWKERLQTIVVCSNTKPCHNSTIFSFGCLRIYPTISPPIHF